MAIRDYLLPKPVRNWLDDRPTIKKAEAIDREDARLDNPPGLPTAADPALNASYQRYAEDLENGVDHVVAWRSHPDRMGTSSLYRPKLDSLGTAEQETARADEAAIAAIRDVQKTMRQAEMGVAHYGNPDDPAENIGPWDRAAKAIERLSENQAATEVLGQHGITFKNGWLHGPDGVSVRSHQLNAMTATPDLPREVTVEGYAGRPPSRLTTGVVERPGMRPEYRFEAIVRRDGEVMSGPGNQFRAYPSKEEAWKQAPVLMRDMIDDRGLKVIGDPERALTAPRDFSDMITSALEASGLDAKDQVRALQVIDNAAVYLHHADPANRAARTALPGSISAEWNQLGITEAQADEMVSKAITYVHERANALRPEQVAERLAAEMAPAQDLSIERETPSQALGR